MNAGGLRLIRKSNVSDSITIYATNCDYIITVSQPYLSTASSKALDYSSSIFDNRFIRFSPDLERKRLQSGTPAFLTTQSSNIKSFAFMLEQDKDAVILCTIKLKENKSLAEKLLLLLQKEYHLSPVTF